MAGDGGVYGWHFWGGVLTLNKYFLFEKRITWQHIIYTLCPRKQMNMFNHTGWKQSCLHTQSQRRSNLLAQTTIQWQVWTSAFPFYFLPSSFCPFFLPLPSLPPSFLSPQLWACTYACIYVSVQFSLSVVSNSLRLHGLQHARMSCPSPTPRAYSNSCPLSQWCHPNISSSAVLFSL